MIPELVLLTIGQNVLKSAKLTNTCVQSIRFWIGVHSEVASQDTKNLDVNHMRNRENSRGA